MPTELITWSDLANKAPELAEFGAARFATAPCYLATIRHDGSPHVHPVTPIVSSVGLHVFMEARLPKGTDLRRRNWFALHNGVPDNDGTGGEFFLRGHGILIVDPDIRAAVAEAATYHPADRYVLFELRIIEARSNNYGDLPATTPDRWPIAT